MLRSLTTPVVVLATMWAAIHHVDAYGELDRFLIVSSSSTHQIAYAPIPHDALKGDIKLRELITSGLVFPQGLAVDPWRRYLYVADPELNKLVYYVLDPRSSDVLYTEGTQHVAATGVQVRWVACDDLGNVFFTDESTQRIMRIPAHKLDSGDRIPEVLFDHTNSGQVSAPGGIAVDNYYTYWTNKQNADTAGTVIKSLHAPQSEEKKLLKVNKKTYGLCLAVNNLFFTDDTNNLYGIPRLGGIDTPVTVSSAFEEARGCAWDGQNTVYVADKKKNAVFQFAAAMPILRTDMPIRLVANMQGAFGVAVYKVSQAAGALGLSPSMLASVMLPVLAAILSFSAAWA